MSALMSDTIDPELSTTISELGEGRASGARMKDGVVSFVLDVGGLDAQTRDALAERIKRAVLLSPEIKDVRIAMTAEKTTGPLIVAVGSGKGGVGKSTLSANLAVALHRMGKRVGMTSTDGIVIDGRLMKRGDMSGPKSAQMVLQNPTVDTAVFEVARGGILREGLGYDRNDVAVVTNVAGDHLGLLGPGLLQLFQRVRRGIPDVH